MSLFPKFIPAKPAKVAKVTLVSKDSDKVARIVNGELLLLHSVEDLAQVIVDLTKDDLPEQKRLLRLHCQKYKLVTHFWKLKEQWEERAAILEYDEGISREEAEYNAAERYHLLAFMDELKSSG